MTSEWRPIETAPVDGTAVWLFLPTYALGGRHGAWVMVQGFNLAEDRRGWRAFYGGGGVEPTHWMPLPAPPTTQEGE